jgi:hypothetical protein
MPGQRHALILHNLMLTPFAESSRLSEIYAKRYDYFSEQCIIFSNILGFGLHCHFKRLFAFYHFNVQIFEQLSIRGLWTLGTVSRTSVSSSPSHYACDSFPLLGITEK